MYIEVVVKVLVILMALLLIVSTFSVVLYSQKLNSAADEIRRMVEVDGKFDSSENQKAEQLLSDNGITNATVSCTANGDIQINTPFSVTVKGNGKLGIGGVSIVSVPLFGDSTGFSNVYWK
jgi:Flp pilus assembly protein TadG